MQLVIHMERINIIRCPSCKSPRSDIEVRVVIKTRISDFYKDISDFVKPRFQFSDFYNSEFKFRIFTTADHGFLQIESRACTTRTFITRISDDTCYTSVN